RVETAPLPNVDLELIAPRDPAELVLKGDTVNVVLGVADVVLWLVEMQYCTILVPVHFDQVDAGLLLVVIVEQGNRLVNGRPRGWPILGCQKELIGLIEIVCGPRLLGEIREGLGHPGRRVR